MFLVLSGIFFFQKNPALSHITKYEPLTPYYDLEKTNEPFLRKLTDRQDGQGGGTVGRTDSLS